MTSTPTRLARLSKSDAGFEFARVRVWLAAAVIFLTPLTSNLPRGVPIPFFHLNEIVLIVAFGLMLLGNFAAGTRARNALLRITWFDPLFALLFVTGALIPLLGYVIDGTAFGLPNILHLFDLIQFYMLYRILLVAVGDKRQVLMCALALVAAGIVIAVIGMMEARDVPGVRQFIQTYYPTYNLTRNIAIGYPRVMAFLGSPQDYGAFLAISIFVCLTLLLYARNEIPKWFVGVALVICFLGLIPSGAYSALIGTALMFGLLLFFYRRLPIWAWGAGALALVLGGIVFAPQIINRFRFQFRASGNVIPSTLLGRLDHWRRALALLKPADWLLGFRGVMPSDLISFENQYLALVFRGGILYLLAYIYFLLRALLESYKLFRTQQGILQAMGLCTFIVLVGMSVMSMTDSYFTNSGVSEAIWTLVGLTAASTFARNQTPAT